jgi:hypothetical protein
MIRAWGRAATHCALAAAAITASPVAAADWAPRQVRIIKAADEVALSGAFALMNKCRVANGPARLAAGQSQLEKMVPALEGALSKWAVHEIFVLRAPVIAGNALPPAKCKAVKKPKPGPEAAMARYEKAVDALSEALRAP